LDHASRGVSSRTTRHFIDGVESYFGRRTARTLPLEHGPGIRVDATDITLVPFPGSVPQLTVNPSHARVEAIRLDGALDGAGLWIAPKPHAARRRGDKRIHVRLTSAAHHFHGQVPLTIE
jgi:hypothetical protein